jgi:hypothetical protein
MPDDPKTDLGPTLADIVKRLAAHEEWSKAEMKKIDDRLSSMTPQQQKEVVKEIKEAQQEDRPFDLMEWLFS